LISVPIIAALASIPMQAAPVKQTILEQVPQNQDAAITEALYQDFLYTTKNMPLQVGDTFPKHTFKTPDGENFTITGKRTLLFVRGALCGSCDKIFTNYEEELSSLKISVVNAVVSVSTSGMPNISYGKISDEIPQTSSPFGVLTSGNMKEVIRHPFGVGSFLIDENSKVRYVSYGFNPKDTNLGVAIKNIKQKSELLQKPINLKISLDKLAWKNPELKILATSIKNFKASLVISSIDTCETCDGLSNELKTFFLMLSKKGYGIFYISNNISKVKIPKVLFIHDEKQEWLKVFNTALYPSSFILKKDKYSGQIYYLKTGFDPNSLSDQSYRNAVLKALEYASR
jgi:peroxiredoxin